MSPHASIGTLILFFAFIETTNIPIVQKSYRARATPCDPLARFSPIQFIAAATGSNVTKNPSERVRLSEGQLSVLPDDAARCETNKALARDADCFLASSVYSINGSALEVVEEGEEVSAVEEGRGDCPP